MRADLQAVCGFLASPGQIADGKYIKAEIKGSSRKGTYMDDPMYSPFFDPDGEVLSIGTRYQRKEYARALQLIADQGVDVLYNGEIGQGIVDAVQAAGGLMTLKDLQGEALI